MSVDLYFDMIGRKTAALISASIEAGALLATEDEDVIARYRAFGWALGLAFQLNDDLLGIWGPEQTTGKEPSDVAHRKKTLPVIYAFEHAGPEDRERLTALYALSRPGTAEAVAEIVEILERTGAREYTRDEARRYRDEALAELDAAGVVRPEARARLEQIMSRSSPPSGPPRRPRGSSALLAWRTARTLPTRRPSVVSTVRVRPSTATWSPGLGTPPIRW